MKSLILSFALVFLSISALATTGTGDLGANLNSLLGEKMNRFTESVPAYRDAAKLAFNALAVKLILETTHRNIHTLLIEGPSGSGKVRFAEQLAHAFYRSQPLVIKGEQLEDLASVTNVFGSYVPGDSSWLYQRFNDRLGRTNLGVLQDWIMADNGGAHGGAIIVDRPSLVSNRDFLRTLVGKLLSNLTEDPAFQYTVYPTAGFTGERPAKLSVSPKNLTLIVTENPGEIEKISPALAVRLYPVIRLNPSCAEDLEAVYR